MRKIARAREKVKRPVGEQILSGSQRRGYFLKVIYIPCEWTKRVIFTVKSTLIFWEWTAHSSRFERQEEYSLSFLAKLNRFGCPFHGWKRTSNTHTHRHTLPWTISPQILTTLTLSLSPAVLCFARTD